ncbi:MAG: serine/threonine protein kinase [Acidobacteria bacterium]|nr:MAG: serine/threonine protein kinase [Acidobacteriota bacterium]PYR47108.1 MAG: serine/threonine protein kinase [Acidobacteriota bacterium]
MTRIGLATIGVLAVVVASRLVAADQWPRFRGTQAGVAADDPALPDRWSETENIAWKIDIPGLAWSSPIVWNDHIFVTSAVSPGVEAAPEKGLYDPGDEHGKTRSTSVNRWIVHDVDFESGRIRWSKEVVAKIPAIGRHIKNSFASETATTDGERVYVYFGAIGLIAALDFDGRIVWTRQVPAHETYFDMGTAASPVLHKDRLYIVHDNLTESFMVALDKRSGAQVWRVAREEPGATWSTPYVWENELRTEIVTPASGKVRSYDLDGKLLWELKGMTILTAPSPFAKHGLVYFSSGYPGDSPRPVYAVRPGATGDISLKPGETSNQYITWYQPTLGTYQTSALVYGDYYYTLLDRGFLLCHDAKTGKQIYGRQRITQEVTGFTASPWAYNGKIFLLSEDGDTYVVQAGPEFKVLGKNSLNEMSLASPAVARGSVIIRTQSKLYRIARK